MKLRRLSALPFERLFLLGYSALFIILMYCSVLSTSRPGAMTWGPTVDFWAATIAISHIQFGLEGGIGYRQLSNEMAKHLTTSGNDIAVFDKGTRALLKDPTRVTAAFQAAANFPRQALKTVSNEDYVNTWAEDIGYADFYDLAFRLFGYSAYSTYHLYFLVLTATVALFAFDYGRSHFGIAVLAVTVGCLFLTSATGVFSDWTPSPAANRYLATLTIVPAVHLLIAGIDGRALPSLRYLVLFLQALLLGVCLTFRTSAGWVPLALLVTYMLTYRGWRSARRASGTPALPLTAQHGTLAGGRLALAVLVVLAAVGLPSTRNAFLDSVYSEVALPRHFIWHSAVVGLTGHPDWPERKPYPDLPLIGDGAAFLWTINYLKDHGRLAELNSPRVMNLINPRLHDRIMREQYLQFAAENPGYMAGLFLKLKPVNIWLDLEGLILGIPVIGWAIFFPMAIVATGILLRAGTVTALMGMATLVVFATSLLPLFWAYSGIHVMSQQVWTALAALFSLCVFLLDRCRHLLGTRGILVRR